MLETLNKLTAEFKKFEELIQANSSMNDHQTSSINELISSFEKLQERISSIENESNSLDDLIIDEIQKITQKTDELAQMGVDVKKLQKLEDKVTKEINELKNTVKSEVEKHKLEKSETDESQDSKIKDLDTKLNDAKIKSVQVDQAQNEEILENTMDIIDLRKTVNKLDKDYSDRMIDKAVYNSVDVRIKRFFKTALKELSRFLIYFCAYELLVHAYITFIQ